MKLFLIDSNKLLLFSLSFTSLLLSLVSILAIPIHLTTIHPFPDILHRKLNQVEINAIILHILKSGIKLRLETNNHNLSSSAHNMTVCLIMDNI
jgi:hypothetical protein